MEPSIYLSKFVAHYNPLSRRAAEQAVKDGRIMLNGVVETRPFVKVELKDCIKFDNKVIRPVEHKKIVIMLNKPEGFITSKADDEGRPTVMSLMPPSLKKMVFPIGRLDFLTKGLLLLTNDGELAQKLSHPKFSVSKIYEVTLDQNASKFDLEKIRQGLYLSDGFIKPDRVYFQSKRANKRVIIEIHSGRNRIVRRIFKQIGLNALRLERIGFAGLSVKGLRLGAYKTLSIADIKKVYSHLGQQKQ